MFRPALRTARLPLRTAARPTTAVWEAAWRRQLPPQPSLATRTSSLRPQTIQSLRLYSTRPSPQGPSLLRSLLFRSPPRRTFRFSSKRASADGATSQGAGAGAGAAGKEAEPQSLGARLRKLSREYGWAAVGVYAVLTVLDLPICFMIVRLVGADRVGAFEHYIVSHIKRVIPESVQTFWHEYRDALRRVSVEVTGGEEAGQAAETAVVGHAEHAVEKDKSGASLGTQLALAYAIHKSIFIFIRVPLTAAITPKVVKTLRSWGWQIGKRRPKTA